MSHGNHENGQAVPAIPLAKLEYQNPNRVECSGTYWREGKSLRVVDGAELPCRCVKCNSSVEVEMRKRTLYWYPQWTFLLIFLNIVIFAVVALCVRRKVSLTYGLCGRHRRLRIWGMISGFGGTALGIVLLILAANSFRTEWVSWIYITSMSVFVAAIASGLTMAHIFRVEAIGEGSAWLRGVSKDFLETL